MMDSNTEDSLEFVPMEKWEELEKAFQADWPRGIPAYNGLVNQRKLVELGLDYGYKVYRPRGHSMSSGMVALNKKGTLNEIIIQCPSNDTRPLEESLINTKLIDWNSRIMVPYMPDHIRQCVVRVAQKLNLNVEAEDTEPNELFLLNNEQPPLEINDNPHYTFKLISDKHDISLVDLTWRNRFEGSDWLFKMLAKAKQGFGLFKNDEELVSWVFISEVGALTHLYTLEDHRNKGYGETLLKQLCNMCLREKRHVFAYCRKGNMNACKLYHKLGFDKFHEAKFNEIIVQCPRDDTSALEEALTTTKIISWSEPIIMPYLPEHMMASVRRVAEKVGMECEVDGEHPPHYLLYYGKERELFENIRLPANVEFQLLKEEHIDMVDSYWVNRYDSSKWIFQFFINMNKGFGLFKDGELVCWVFVNEIGALIHFFTLENHRRMGYGKILIQLVSNILLKENSDVFACCLGENHSALKLYESLGFEKLRAIQWLFMKPK